MDVLDRFDGVMERCCEHVNGNKWMLACDQPENAEVRVLVARLWTSFSFSDHIFPVAAYLLLPFTAS